MGIRIRVFGASFDDEVKTSAFVGDPVCELARGILSDAVGEGLGMLTLVTVGPVVDSVTEKVIFKHLRLNKSSTLDLHHMS